MTEDKFWATPKDKQYNCLVIEENTKVFSGMECYRKYDTPNDEGHPVKDIYYLCAHNINNAGSILLYIINYLILLLTPDCQWVFPLGIRY